MRRNRLSVVQIEAAAWASFQAEHRDELPPPAPAGTPAFRERQRCLGKLFMEFLQSRGRWFTVGRGGGHFAARLVAAESDR